MLASFMPASLRPLAVLCLVVSACASKQKADATAVSPELEDTDDPLGQLERYEAELNELGVIADERHRVTAESSEEGVQPEAAGAQQKSAEDRCTRICGLAEAICELEERICDLATEHRDDARYAEACGRAASDCEAAAAACGRCEGGTP
jgi:hypothetical protein